MIKTIAAWCGRLTLIFVLGILPLKAMAASGEQRPIIRDVVELFTSQGCSSCPPADALMKNYVKRPDVVALSYSVDYWDYLGWRDTFGSSANSQRQRDYARTRGDGAVYTPQVVVNGVSHMNGSHKSQIDLEIQRTHKLLKDRQIQILASSKDGVVSVALCGDIEGTDNALTLWMLRVKDEGVVKIKRGENGGNKFSYHNIVLAAEKVATIRSSSQPVEIAKPKKPLKADEHLVFLLQVGSTGPIIGALEM